MCLLLAPVLKVNRLLFLFLLLRPLTVLMKQTRQVVRAIKQSIFLRCPWAKYIAMIVTNLVTPKAAA